MSFSGSAAQLNFTQLDFAGPSVHVQDIGQSILSQKAFRPMQKFVQDLTFIASCSPLRLQKAFRGECDAECDDQLQHIITVHIRSRYADREVDNATIALAVASDETMQLMPAEHRPAAWFHYAIGNLFLDYVKARGPMNLWYTFLLRHTHTHTQYIEPSLEQL